MHTDQRRRTLLLSAAATAGSLVLPMRASLAQDAVEPKNLDVPYVPTPQDVVDRMLEMGRVGKNDVLYDLGCGDGRIVVTAAKARGARGTGIDLNPVRIAEAQENAKKAGVSDRVNFKVGDLFQADVSPATVVTLYLLPSVNVKLRPRLWQQLKVGTRVVSHAFDMGPDWPPEKKDEVDGRTIYYWTITQANKKAVKA
ncbi:class I SAM-dependent methyltransferase [Massilia sp. IC2-477]|uniref:SAM-dependent methyltransferase n=1 Tax=unclassified Massilia TaxID=2609279 RepID=UPI001D11A666|nr:MULTISPECIES: class I SAM-dependent methyltransferase [unclassified Massilia]MCC2957432.1 class I SAM-dependent methyltransferase [Massilia sp. IC2-477]MCC2973874.1 class I SAM-dependent methyltransferase [Massilia sp. IC2-476]